MFLTLWNYLRGYVIIEVSGFSVERFLNLAVHKGIYLWDISRTTRGILVKVSIKGFKMLKPCAKKTKCGIKISGKRGLPFVLHRYRKRKILIGGTIFFIGVLYFLSSFVWTIEIIGNDRINKSDIIAYSIEAGLKPGTYKRSMDLRQLEKKFMNDFVEISWISISVKGTRAKIELTEIIEKTAIIDRNKPCDIVAAKNGLIISIVTNAGTPKVKAKDVVEEGDILVSGELSIGESGPEQKKEYVHASAEIKAKLWYEVNVYENIKYSEKIYTGETKKNYCINIKDKKFYPLKASIPYDNYDKISNVKKLDFGGDFELPIGLIVEEYKEYTLKETVRGNEEIKKMLHLQIERILENKFQSNVEIVDKNIKYTDEENKIIAKVIITTIEDINKEVEIKE